MAIDINSTGRWAVGFVVAVTWLYPVCLWLTWVTQYVVKWNAGLPVLSKITKSGLRVQISWCSHTLGLRSTLVGDKRHWACEGIHFRVEWDNPQNDQPKHISECDTHYRINCKLDSELYFRRRFSRRTAERDHMPTHRNLLIQLDEMSKTDSYANSHI